MTEEQQEQMAQKFVSRIAREVCCTPTHQGYGLKRSDGKRFRFGHVTYIVRGPNAGKYRVQVRGHYWDDPRGKFKLKNEPRLAEWYVSPCDEDGVRYAVRVLESCYDHGHSGVAIG